MQHVDLDERLSADSYLLGQWEHGSELLMRNAHYPWLVLVPHTEEIEFHRLPFDQQVRLLTCVQLLASFVEQRVAVDKMNIATIGNQVSQMHIHVVGRRRSDPAWPGVVWGAKPFLEYASTEVSELQNALLVFLGEGFSLAS